jgi:hypothetical protein
VALPITIYQNNPLNFGMMQQPPNWNPQVYDCCQFAFSDQYAYQPNPNNNRWNQF